VDVRSEIKSDHGLADDELWFKDAVIYQLHVKTFFDSNNDGIGDFAGLAEKLDYLRDLGVTALWLLPFYPSPGRDDGYDIADYRRVNPEFGSMKDFRRFMQEAKRRHLRVLSELVINHTSDQHPWFKRARRSRRNTERETGTSGAIRTSAMRERASSSVRPRNRTGGGTRKPRLIIGTASSRINPT
jgi:maltose alpha-D-glucosyltransferase/alpha-amylase